MKMLITGASGFIGQHLLGKLKDHEVYTVSRQWPSSSRNINCDIGDLEKHLDQIPEMDVVVHLAGAIPAHKVTDDEMMRVNAEGTRVALRVAKEKHAKLFVYASAAAVYGNQKEFPIGEEASLGPINVYGKSKLEGEKVCEASGVPHAILRFANLFGPDQKKGNFIPDVIERFSRGDTAVRNPDATRDFIYVEDACEAIVNVVESKTTGVMNISSGQETPVRVVAELIAEHFGVEPKYEATSGEISRSVLDNTRIKRTLSWRPKISMQEGIRACLRSGEFL